MAKARRKGFSMLELVFTAGLMGMSVGLFMLSGGTRLKAKPGVDALSQALANDLGQARLLAMRQLSPVAVMFPCDSQRPHSASLYQLEGLTNPHVSRSHNFAGDFPGFAFFLGNWSGTESQAPLVVGTKWSDFDVTQWLPAARAKDCALIFMPDGTVRGVRDGTGLPQFDGEYHIAVSAGIGYSGSNLNAAGETNTVCINGGGAIRVENGLAGSSIRTTGSMPSSNVPSAPVEQTYVGKAQGIPQGNSSLPAPSGTEPTTIPPDGFVTVTAFAKDQNQSGERLFLRWDVIPAAGRGKGVFSIPLDSDKGVAMDFNPNATTFAGSAQVKPAYQSSYQWRPPADAQPKDVFTLQLMIQNQDTGVWTPVKIQEVKIAPYGAVLFEYSKGGERGLYRMHANGTGTRRFHVAPSTPAQPRNFHEYCPAVSPDGNRILFLSNDRPGVPAGCQDIFLTDRDGLTCVPVTRGLRCEAACFSPDGSHVAFKNYNGSVYQLCVVPVAPTTTAITPAHVLPSGGAAGTVLDGRETASGFLRHVYRDERCCWVPGDSGDPDKIYFAQTLYGHQAPGYELGDHPFLFYDKVSRSGAPISGPTNFQPDQLQYGSWSAARSPFSGNLYSALDGSDHQGDPFIKLGGAGWSIPWLGSPGFYDSQPTAYLRGEGAGTEALLICRSPASDPANNQRICRLPRGATNDAEIENLTPDLSASNATWPVYLR
ncbi:MAG: PD40 domain-containing protein [Candidatus Eremiobacteraeota bacterium]|nr:PD40 domain-containing protein [Candidatus Eremiobacteraeota bacterium]